MMEVISENTGKVSMPYKDLLARMWFLSSLGQCEKIIRLDFVLICKFKDGKAIELHVKEKFPRLYYAKYPPPAEAHIQPPMGVQHAGDQARPPMPARPPLGFEGIQPRPPQDIALIRGNAQRRLEPSHPALRGAPPRLSLFAYPVPSDRLRRPIHAPTIQAVPVPSPPTNAAATTISLAGPPTILSPRDPPKILTPADTCVTATPGKSLQTDFVLRPAWYRS